MPAMSDIASDEDNILDNIPIIPALYTDINNNEDDLSNSDEDNLSHNDLNSSYCVCENQRSNLLQFCSLYYKHFCIL
jgi:hypothetical protein